MFKKIKRYLKDPYYALGNDMIKKCPRLMPDKFYLSVMWKSVMGYEIDWKHPVTFCEKLQWLKLYNRNPLYTTLVDKYHVKQWVAKKIGGEYVIPTIAVYESVDEIDINELPERFVLKCNHDSGSIIICQDKKQFDLKAAKESLNRALNHNFYLDVREWPYKNVPRCIFAEEFIDPSPQQDLLDYKFFCFNGVAKYCQVISGRGKKMCVDFFDHEWRHQPFHEPREYPFAEKEPERPKFLEKMWEAAEKLAEEKPFSRIDFYEVGDVVYFGEITFFPTAGLGGFSPKEYDTFFGQLISLPDKL